MAGDTIRKGQVYASVHAADRAQGVRQRRHVVDVSLHGAFAWLRTERPDGSLTPKTRVRLRDGRLPGHQLIEDAGG